MSFKNSTDIIEEDMELCRGDVVDTPLSDDEIESQCDSDLTINEFSSTESDDNDEPCMMYM